MLHDDGDTDSRYSLTSFRCCDFLDKLFGCNLHEHKGWLIFLFVIIWPALSPILLSIHWTSYGVLNRCSQDPVYRDKSWYPNLLDLVSNNGICVGLSLAGVVINVIYFMSLVFFGLFVSRRRRVEWNLHSEANCSVQGHNPAQFIPVYHILLLIFFFWKIKTLKKNFQVLFWHFIWP